MNEKIRRLADLIRQHNTIGDAIAEIIGRPAFIGHAGEFIAKELFGIKLEDSATKKGVDGRFLAGPLAGRSVNVKWYTKDDGLLDLTPASLPDYYLVMRGPKAGAISSKGTKSPWVIHTVYLFEAYKLAEELRTREVKMGVATSVRRQLWEKAEIYPSPKNNLLALSDNQREQLALFSETVPSTSTGS